MKTYRLGSDMAFVYGEVGGMELGSTHTFSDFHVIELHLFRMALNKISKDFGVMYKTRYDKVAKVLDIERIA